MTKILVIDDEPGVLRFIRRALETEGHAVVTAADGAEGLRLAVDLRPPLVILDLMLPGISGRAVLAALLADVRPTRVLALCDPDDVPVRIRALDASSIDFLPKPFSLNGLLTHVRTRVRQDRVDDVRPEPVRQEPAPERELFCGTLRLDLSTRRLHAQNRSVELSQREFALMQHLMRRSGRVCSRAELLAEVWGYAFDPGSNVVDVTIARLRSKIKGLRIETVRKVGYALQPA